MPQPIVVAAKAAGLEAIDGPFGAYKDPTGLDQSARLARLLGVRQALLKAKSPSCGSGSVYDGSFSGRRVLGDGVTAALLRQNGITVRNEEEIDLL